MNAYDTVTRPIQTILNQVNAGNQDKDGMMDDFIVGVYEASKELGAPFVTESIWTQALADLYFRKGRTPEGFKVFDGVKNIIEPFAGSGDLLNFMQTYQRITQQMFKDGIKSSSIIMNLNSRHQIQNIRD